MEIKTILFPTDFSDRANRATGEVVNFAHHIKAKLIICHFYYRPIPDNSSYQDVDDKLLREKERQIDHQFTLLETFFPKMKNLEVKFIKKFGSITESLAYYIDEYSVDMVAMATKGARGLDEFFGSKTYKTSKNLRVPLLAIPDGSRLSHLQRIGLATSYDADEDLSKLHILKHVAKAHKAHITLVKVVKKEPENAPNNESVNNQALKIHEALDPIDHTFTYTVHPDVAMGLIDFCKTKEIDMVCVLPSKRNFLEEMLHDSITRRLVHLMPLPILIFK